MSPPSASGPNLQHVQHWVFDLDDTLYPPEAAVMALVQGRINDFMIRACGLEPEAARTLQKRYLTDHGTTLAGLMLNHRVDPRAFLDEVHEVSLDNLMPDPVLREGLLRLPGRRLVFTNGSARHAERVLEKMALADLFEDVFHIEAADLIPKPDPRAFHGLIRRHGVEPRAAAFFEDTARNLEPAAQLGMTTILVGPRALTDAPPYVDHRTERLPPFLNALTFGEPR